MRTNSIDITFNGRTIGTTPLLIPSFSSQAGIPFPFDLTEVVNFSLDFINDCFLISAYDIYYKKIQENINYSNLDFLVVDSGGYECISGNDLTDIGNKKENPNDWSYEQYIEIINNFSADCPISVVSYDNPNKSYVEQIKCANLCFEDKDVIKEILIKSEVNGPIDIKKLLLYQDELFDFDIIGFTEKELGYNILDRMYNIAQYRERCDEVGIDTPIHIFGSLDPTTTSLYYISGADVFDGLSWLKYSFDKGNTSYINSIGPIKWGIETDFQEIWLKSIEENYYYLKNFETILRKVFDTNDLEVLKKIGLEPNFLESASEKLDEVIKR